MYRMTVCLGAALLAAAACDVASAQQPGQFPSPQRPAFSPYLNFFLGPDPGVLDRYNAYVRPALAAQQVQRQTQLQIGALNAQLGAIQTQQRPTQFSRTGIGARFQYYSHFYPAPQPVRRR